MESMLEKRMVKKGFYKSYVKILHPSDDHLPKEERRVLFEGELIISDIIEGVKILGWDIKYYINGMSGIESTKVGEETIDVKTNQ